MADISNPLVWRAFSMPKAGHDREEYEDAVAGNAAACRFAIADGASESSFAGAWADLLVKGFTAHSGSWRHWLPDARKAWHDNYKDREFSWYAEEKFLTGAYATFLGIFFDAPDLRWRAAAIGDSCLFHLRDGRRCRAFPVRRSREFGNQPDLIGSRQSLRKIKRLRWQGDWQQQDRMFLMTDALAQWFLQQMENENEPWKDVLSIGTPDAFETWIVKNRELKDLRNDDVTLMVIGSETKP